MGVPSTNTPTLNMLSYDGVATTKDNKTVAVVVHSLSLESNSTLKESGIRYCVVAGTSEAMDVPMTAALEEIGGAMTMKNNESTCDSVC